MACALFACGLWHGSWPVALCALPAFVCLLVLSRSAFTPSGRFGYANAVTTLRLSLVLTIAVLPLTLASVWVLALVITILLLDLLDGWLARRHGDASLFGAHFDMETDALLVLVVTLRLWLSQGFGPWVLFAGLLRYSYVSWLWLWPGTGREAPRSRFGRAAFGILMVGLCVGLELPGLWGTTGVCLGTLAVTWAFARSCYFSRLAS